jgi:hypothetical protein
MKVLKNKIFLRLCIFAVILASQLINTKPMKRSTLNFGIIAILFAVLLSSCSTPVTLTSWKNPGDNTTKVSKVVVIALFNKLEYVKPFEQSTAAYFESQGLKCVQSLEILNPTMSYTAEQIRKKVDSLGGDGVLVVKYKGTDKSSTYVPATYYGGFYGYYGGGFYGGGSVSGGYWSTTSTVNLSAYLYVANSNKEGALWTGDLTVTDPQYVDQAATQVAQKIYADWKNNNLLKAQAIAQ